MRISAACPESLLCITTVLVLLAEISTAGRARRQIHLEDESEEDGACRAPDGKPGRCVTLTACGAFTQTAILNQLRRYICGYEGDSLKVCCPLSSEEEATSTRPNTKEKARTAGRLDSTGNGRQCELGPDASPDTDRPDASPETDRPDASPDTEDFLPKSCGKVYNTFPRIQGARKSEKGTWTWMAVIFVRRSNGALFPDCAGALVTNQHVITAAHCVVSGRRSVPMDPSRIVVRLGAYNLSKSDEPDAIDVEVESVRPHEEFESRIFKNDIAVLKLKRPVAFTEAIAPVCLPYDSILTTEDLTGRSAFLIGHGEALNGDPSDFLMESWLDIQSQNACETAYKGLIKITQFQLCAGSMSGSKDDCHGYSGSPLMATGENHDFYLVGLLLFGKKCEEPGYPEVYTRVTAYLDWLSQNLSK